jgi:type VI secretion system protein ImpH
MGHETDAVKFFAALAEAPYRYDFYQTLRRLECLFDSKPRWGSASRPADEPVRLGQDPDLSFSPASLASFTPAGDTSPPRLQVRLFGLLGPNGPLPIHMTEYVRERLRHAGDPTLSRFLDLLHHRFIAMFYRAWAQAQPHVSRDRPEEDRFAAYLGALFGISTATLRERDAVPDAAKLFHAGTLIRQVRNADGLAAILNDFFRVPVQIREFIGHWLDLSVRDRTYLAHGAMLGAGAVLGAQVWDRQAKFRIVIGPLTLSQYESFLPGGSQLRQFVAWVRNYLCFELEWDVQLVLKASEVPGMRLGKAGKLGWTTWLGTRTASGDAPDLCLDAEAFVCRT